jgi:hypothetical protein
LQFVTHFIIGINIGKVRRASRRLRACGEDIYLNTKTVTVIRRYSEKHATLSKPDHVGKQFQSRRFCCIICVSHIFAYSINGTQELSANWVLRRQIALCSVDGSLELSHCHVGKVFTNHISPNLCRQWRYAMLTALCLSYMLCSSSMNSPWCM